MNAFYAGQNCGPSAEGWPFIQLLNPSDSGVEALLDQSWIYHGSFRSLSSSHLDQDTQSAWSIRLRRLDAPLLNPESGPKQLGVNAVLGGPESKCEIRFYCNSIQATDLGTEIIQLEGGDGRVNGTQPVDFKNPIVIPPGVGVVWVCTAWKTLLRASFGWREKEITL